MKCCNVSLIGCPPNFQYSRNTCSRPCSELKGTPAEEAHSQSHLVQWICWETKGWRLSWKCFQVLCCGNWLVSTWFSLREAYHGGSSLRAEIGMTFWPRRALMRNSHVLSLCGDVYVLRLSISWGFLSCVLQLFSDQVWKAKKCSRVLSPWSAKRGEMLPSSAIPQRLYIPYTGTGRSLVKGPSSWCC